MADQATEGLLSPFLRRQRINAARPYLKGSVLDVGCGSGVLAELISPDNYMGVERDDFSLRLAEVSYPNHRYRRDLNDVDGKFDTVVALAVIEHVPSPRDFLEALSSKLKDKESGRLVITTPHPRVDWVHEFGAKIGLFSKHANEEHEELLDRKKLEDAATKAGLLLDVYRIFLFGANQLAVFRRLV